MYKLEIKYLIVTSKRLETLRLKNVNMNNNIKLQLINAIRKAKNIV